MMRIAHIPPWVMSLILHKYDDFILESIKIGIDIIVSARIENLKRLNDFIIFFLKFYRKSVEMNEKWHAYAFVIYYLRIECVGQIECLRMS